MKRKKYIAASLISLVALWFLGIDWSWFVHECPDCGYGKDVVQYRLFTIPIRETTYESSTITQLVADDLGVPCQHCNSTSWYRNRLWGLLICKSPCFKGTHRISFDNSWYDQDVSTKVAALAANDRSISHEFVRKALKRHDYTFVDTVLDRAGVK